MPYTWTHNLLGADRLPPTNITMSTSHHDDASSPTFQSIFDAALDEYKKKTDRDLRTHPLAAELDHCNSHDAILLVFQKQADALDQARKSNKTFLNPLIHILHMFSESVAKFVGIVSLNGLTDRDHDHDRRA